MALSAVRILRNGRRILNKNSITGSSARKMSASSDWKTAKANYLEMPLEEKRGVYKCGSNFKTCNQLPTWEEYYRTKTPLAGRIPILGGYVIDDSKNAELAKKISVFGGDIVTLEINAIVNAANQRLLGGGGVDGAIHRAAGPDLKEECRSLDGCSVGEAKMTGGYNLPAKYVIHTVGPQREKPDLLTACYKNCLDIALRSNLRTIAFPGISTGVYGYPIDKAAQVACRQVRTFLEKNTDKIDRIIFCVFRPEDVNMYEGTLQSYFPVA